MKVRRIFVSTESSDAFKNAFLNRIFTCIFKLHVKCIFSNASKMHFKLHLLTAFKCISDSTGTDTRSVTGILKDNFNETKPYAPFRSVPFVVLKMTRLQGWNGTVKLG